MGQLEAISEEQFRALLGTKLGQHLERTVAVLTNFGPRLSFDVANVMLHAADKSKVVEVLDILEKHWNEHLKFQHLEIRGLIAGEFGINLTQQTFLKICQETLGLTPTTVG